MQAFRRSSDSSLADTVLVEKMCRDRLAFMILTVNVLFEVGWIQSLDASGGSPVFFLTHSRRLVPRGSSRMSRHVCSMIIRDKMNLDHVWQISLSMSEKEPSAWVESLRYWSALRMAYPIPAQIWSSPGQPCSNAARTVNPGGLRKCYLSSRTTWSGVSH